LRNANDSATKICIYSTSLASISSDSSLRLFMELTARRAAFCVKALPQFITLLLSICFAWAVTSTAVYAADYYVNGSCSVNGNGTAGKCARSVRGVGAWNSFSAIASGTAGDVIHIRGGTYSNQMDYYKFPSGINGSPGDPLIVQNYAGEDVTL